MTMSRWLRSTETSKNVLYSSPSKFNDDAITPSRFALLGANSSLALSALLFLIYPWIFQQELLDMQVANNLSVAMRV